MRANVVGGGVMGSYHQRALTSLGFEVTMIDLDPSKGEYRTQLQAPPAEVVCVSTPPSALVEQAGQAILCGAETVLVEKPLALNVTTAQALIEVSEANGTNVGVGFIERANPGVSKLRDRLPEVGIVHSVKVSRLGPAPGRPTAGPVFDLLTHDLDMLYALGLEPQALMSARVDDQEAWASICLPHGEAELRASYTTPEKVRTITITGEDGSLELDYQTQSINGETSEPVEPLIKQWKALLRGEPFCGLRDALSGLSLALSVDANGR